MYEKMALKNSFNTKIVFDKLDVDSINSLRDSFLWVGDEYSAKTQDKIKDIIQSAFNGETNRADIASKLKEEFGLLLEKDISYFELVADNAISQGQNIATINQSLQYDVKYFKVVARLDDKTSPICRSMHGKIISAKHLRNQVNNIVNAKNIDEKKQSAKWSNEPIYSKLPNNIGVPPYHGCCRTILEPVWVSEDIVDGKVVRYVDKNDNDLLTHIDNTDKQRRVNKKTFNHSQSSRARKIPLKDVVSAFNSIKEIAPHSTEKNKVVALSRNGYFMVFDDEYLLTIFKEPRKNYFKDNAIKEKTEVIKWKDTTLTYATGGRLKMSNILTKVLKWKRTN